MKKPSAKLNPLECGICKFQGDCLYGKSYESLYRTCSSIPFADCALYNGGRVVTEDGTSKDITKVGAV